MRRRFPVRRSADRVHAKHESMSWDQSVDCIYQACCLSILSQQKIFAATVNGVALYQTKRISGNARNALTYADHAAWVVDLIDLYFSFFVNEGLLL